MQKFPLGFQWPTIEPFIFCVHHLDEYPKGETNLGPPRATLAGRSIGSDFVPKDGFRMYHGDTVPGFPVHPHRGFETVTIVRRGYVDHADSMGAAGRYGEGDVQWMTAGKGVQHSEMFPLLDQTGPNTTELFQIWLNLPARNKMVDPHFTMFWQPEIPVVREGGVEVTVIAGTWGGKKALAPPPNSWAAEPAAECSILLVRLDAGASLKLPSTGKGVTRTLYLYSGAEFVVGSETVPSKNGVVVDGFDSVTVSTKGSKGEFLLLQARPIGEPVAQRGPFVMNTEEELKKAFSDYRATMFGGWPWPRPDMVHGDKKEKFAKYPDGSIKKPTSSR
jgi:redox-sensitive bicupin YhaK (pirin superfamily)